MRLGLAESTSWILLDFVPNTISHDTRHPTASILSVLRLGRSTPHEFKHAGSPAVGFLSLLSITRLPLATPSSRRRVARTKRAFAAVGSATPTPDPKLLARVHMKACADIFTLRESRRDAEFRSAPPGGRPRRARLGSNRIRSSGWSRIPPGPRSNSRMRRANRRASRAIISASSRKSSACASSAVSGIRWTRCRVLEPESLLESPPRPYQPASLRV
jgi:hypothetical protein